MELTQAFSHMKPIKVLLIGDLMLDVYTIGKVGRISPEAPVPILHAMEERRLPGGAGNVALNLVALGAEVDLVGRVGDDSSGQKLLTLLKSKKLSTRGVFTEEGSITPLKNRYIADGQQLMRADCERVELLSRALEEEIQKFLSREIPQYDIIAISDYGKGTLSRTLLSHIMNEAKAAGIRVVVDPKDRDISKYRGAFLIKPNLKEAYATVGMERDEPIEDVAAAILEKIELEHLLITRSEQGMSLFSKGKEPCDFPVEKREVLDVTGAGDTALAMLTFALGNELTIGAAITLANIASGIAISQLGCVAVKLSEVAYGLLQRDPMSKIFDDEENLFVLHKAIEEYRVITLSLGMQQEMSNRLFQTIQEISSRKKEAKLIIILATSQVNKDFVKLLASMREVDFVIAHRGSYDQLIEALSPVERIEESLLLH